MYTIIKHQYPGWERKNFALLFLLSLFWCWGHCVETVEKWKSLYLPCTQLHCIYWVHCFLGWYQTLELYAGSLQALVTFSEDSVGLNIAGTHFEPFKRPSRNLVPPVCSSFWLWYLIMNFCPILWFYLPISKQLKNTLLNILYVTKCVSVCVYNMYKCIYFTFNFGNWFFKNLFVVLIDTNIYYI